MSQSTESKVADKVEEHTETPTASKTDTPTSGDDTEKHNPKSEETDAKPSSTESSEVKSSGKSDDSAEPGKDGDKKKKEDVNSDGFVPGTPLSKNHPDSTAQAKREAKEHEKESGKTKTGDDAEKHHEGLGSKLKHALHHDKKEA